MNRLCSQKYCSGIARISVSMKTFMRRVSSSMLGPGKSAQAGPMVTTYYPSVILVMTGSTAAPVMRARRDRPVMVAAGTPKNGTNIVSRRP